MPQREVQQEEQGSSSLEQGSHDPDVPAVRFQVVQDREVPEPDREGEESVQIRMDREEGRLGAEELPNSFQKEEQRTAQKHVVDPADDDDGPEQSHEPRVTLGLSRTRCRDGVLRTLRANEARLYCKTPPCGKPHAAPRSRRIARAASRWFRLLRLRIRSVPSPFHSTTVLAVRRSGRTTLAADGQVTLGDIVVKHGARKLRRMGEGAVLAGFAGATADAQALFAKFEAKLEGHRGNLERACVELAQDWRTDRVLRHLDALLLVADKDHVFLLSGDGDLMQPDDGIMAIGAGAPFAMAAARALASRTELSAREIAEEAMRVTDGICIYTNGIVIFEEV